MTTEEFRQMGHAFVDWIANYRGQIENFPVMSGARPGEIKTKFPSAPPQAAAGLQNILPEVERAILPGITHWNHPSFFAYFPSNTSLASVLADFLSAGFGA